MKPTAYELKNAKLGVYNQETGEYEIVGDFPTVRESFKVGDGRTEIVESQEHIYGENIIPSIQQLLTAYEHLNIEIRNIVGKLPDEHATARKRSHDDMVAKRKELFKRHGKR